jgi:MFS family permease
MPQLDSAKMPYSVYLLALCQALMMSATSLLIVVAALVGFSLAEDKALATLPLSIQFLALMLTSIPASFIMQRWGRKAGFYLASVIGLSGGLLAIWAILNVNFWAFVASTACIGIFNGFGNYFRFAAVDIAHESIKSKAISYVMVGGVLAAFIGPNLARLGKPIFEDSIYAGAYVYVVLIYILMIIVLYFLKLPAPEVNQTKQETRSVINLFKQPKFLVAVICSMFGYAVMSLVMTATPLAMKHNMHALDDTAFVIQWHVLGMFAPSFFTGSLIKRFGVLNILLAGVVLAYLAVATNLMGVSIWHFWTGLIFLGLSWNFLFIGGTTLLTDAYLPAEKAKAQATNDFVVFSTVASASLFAGYLQHHFGWQMVNVGVLPAITLMLLAVLWLKQK